jgi:hypothetical protein
MESPFVAVQHGFDNVLANWPLLLIRIGEQVAMIVLIVVSVLAGVLPVIFWGLGSAQVLEGVSTPEEAVEFLLGNLLPILYILVVLTIALLLAMIIHSFVQGGVVGCYIEGERRGRTNPGVARARYRVFTPDLWFRNAKRTWWPIFLIYNIVWGVFGLVLLIPLLAIALIIFLMRDSPELIALTCVGVVLLFGFLFIAAYVVHIWSTVAIVLNVMGQRVGQALREGWTLMIRRALPFVAIVVIALAVSVSAFGSVFGASFAVGLVSHVPGFGIVTLPLQVVISLLQTAVSIVVYAWFLAAAVSIVLQR